MSSDIIDQAIRNMAEVNAKANGDLSAHMKQMRERIELAQSIYTGGGSEPLPTEPNAAQEYIFKRAQLTHSAWASEVIAAAALDEEFLKETGEKARAILIENDMYPGTQEPNISEPPNDTGEPNADSTA